MSPVSPPHLGPTHAMLLAAGLGTRMRPLTDDRPKPMVSVAGKPMIDYILDHLDVAGVPTIVVNVHYLADVLETHLRKRTDNSTHKHTQMSVLISDERERLLDSGGGVRKALPLLGTEPFFLLNADSFWIEGPQNNLVRMAQAFDPDRMDILLLLAPTTTSVGWGNRGDYAFAQDGQLRRAAKGEMTPFAYAGVAIFKQSIFDDAPEVFSLLTLFDAAQGRGRLFGLRLDGIWMHIGTPEAVIEAERRIAESVR